MAAAAECRASGAEGRLDRLSMACLKRKGTWMLRACKGGEGGREGGREKGRVGGWEGFIYKTGCRSNMELSVYQTAIIGGCGLQHPNARTFLKASSFLN